MSGKGQGIGNHALSLGFVLEMNMAFWFILGSKVGKAMLRIKHSTAEIPLS